MDSFKTLLGIANHALILVPPALMSGNIVACLVEMVIMIQDLLLVIYVHGLVKIVMVHRMVIVQVVLFIILCLFPILTNQSNMVFVLHAQMDYIGMFT